jgi:outer membrane protein OmpA-like peptidoglycan-associated protein
MVRAGLVAAGVLCLGLAGGAVVASTFAPASAKTPVKAAPTRIFPDYLTFPAGMVVAPGTTPDVEKFGQADFYIAGSDDAVVQKGKHWRADLTYNALPESAAGKDIWAKIKPALVAGGWTIPIEYDSNPFSAMMRYQKNGKDVWGYLKIFGRDDMRLQLVEVGGGVDDFVLPPPAAKPETVAAAKGDFPYLLPLPGSKFLSGSTAGGQFTVAMKDGEQTVALASIVKFYAPPDGTSNLAFVTSYATALTKAGWTIVQQGDGASATDVTLTARYTKNGRNIWAYLHNTGAREYSIKVADIGADDLGAKLAKTCHVAVYGVLYDYNKSTLKPESDGTLGQILGVMQKNAALKIEIQGHTDNVGGDAYNQTLSEARAKSVVNWLTRNGVPEARLTFKGYGKTQPVATNDTDEGRTKNRRVEVARPGCTGK